MTALPAPLTGPDCTLPGGSWIKLYPDRVLDSEFLATSDFKVIGVSLLLWARACRQVPAGSLPDNDELLAYYVFGRGAVKRWQKMKAAVMKAWTLCADGRWYHPTVCEAAQEAAQSLDKAEAKREADARRLAEKRTGYRAGKPAPLLAGIDGYSEANDDRAAIEVSQNADKSRRDIAATSRPIEIDIDLTPPSPQGGGVGVSFNDFERLWAPQDPTDSSEAALRAFSKLSSSERLAAIDGADVYKAAILKDGRKLCNRATYLRDKRWKDLARPSAEHRAKAPEGVWIVEGSQQAKEWAWYRQKFEKKRSLIMWDSRLHKNQRGCTVPSEWPPVRMTEAPEMLMPISSDGQTSKDKPQTHIVGADDMAPMRRRC